MSERATFRMPDEAGGSETDTSLPSGEAVSVAALRNYRDWLEYQWTERPPPQLLRFGEGRNLVLAAALGYPPEGLGPFVRSLRAESNCRAALIVDDNPRLLDFLAENRIDAIVWRRPRGYEPHMNFARMAGFLHALRRLSADIDCVFWTDSRDVVFQSDPFANSMEGKLVFFSEAADFTFRRSRMNRRWLRTVCGPIAARSMLDRTIVSGGLLLARAPDAMAYTRLKLLTGLALPRWVLDGPGVDQITTNLIAHLEMVDHSVIVANDGRVATLGPNRHYRLDGGGRIVGANGRVSPVFHQYDREPILRAAVYARHGSVCADARPRAWRSRLRRLYYHTRKTLHLARLDRTL